MTELGPVSEVLAAELRAMVQKHGLVVWLDAEGAYSGFVDALGERGREPYDVVAYRGSYLELVMRLGEVGQGADRAPLLVHMPQHNEESIRRTPALEVYAAGTRYRKKLATLIGEAAAGEATPEQVQAFVAGPCTLEGADAWLEALRVERSGGLRAQLQMMSVGAILDDLLGHGPLAQRLGERAAREVVVEKVAASAGLSAAWRRLTPEAEQPRDLAFVIASWALAVEYTHDLTRATRAPVLAGLGGLARPLVEGCRAVAVHLRARQPAFYKEVATEVEGWLGEEITDGQAKDLGKVDTFRFEEDRVLREALELLSTDAAGALAWAVQRLGQGEGGSFWLADDPGRRSAWLLIEAGARLGEAIAAAQELGAGGGLDEAVDRYVEVGAAVDEAHRRLEQRRAALLFPQVPYFERLRLRLDALRERWRTWADGWARDFNLRAKAHGFLPQAGLMQRTLFNEVVAPLLADDGPTALFMVDALRYEMGAELSRHLTQPGSTVKLKARLAELPTTTEIGMNALAPVCEGAGVPRLKVALRDGEPVGFSSGELRVVTPETRRRVMADRAAGSKCPLWTLDEVLGREAASLRQGMAGARLVVVHSQEIDQAGEKGVGALVFEQVLQKLVAACHLLRDAGVRRVVVTADHGFLLLDETAQEAQPHGRVIDPQRRHVVSTVAADHRDEVRVPLAELGYEGAPGLHLMMPLTTAVFDRGRRNKSFAHGGNSLQERVIPALTLTHKVPPGASAGRYALSAEEEQPVAGMQCFSGVVELEGGQLGLSFASARTVDLALRAAEGEAGFTVELCQARGAAELVAGAVRAQVGKRFEVFFRLLAPREGRARVVVHHPGTAVELAPTVLPGWFEVARRGDEPGEPAPDGRAWLEELGIYRAVFEHLAEHGSVGEAEVARLLGGARGARRFALELDGLARRVPFRVTVDASGSEKRYVRGG